MRPCGRRPSCSRRRMSRRTTSASMRAHYRCKRGLRLSGNSLQSQEGFTSGRPSLVDSPPAILHRGAHTADLPRSRTRPTRPAPPTLKEAVVIGSCGVALLLGACAIANTPQQDLAYTRWAKCNSTSGTLERIDLDGRITFRYTTAGERQEIVQCLEKPAARGRRFPSPSAFALWEGRNRAGWEHTPWRVRRGRRREVTLQTS